MAGVPEPIFDLAGRRIGTVRAVSIGRNRATFWEARSLDGCDLGAHRQRVEAEEAIWDDWEAGRPRNPDNIHDRFRPVFANGRSPVYLGR